jgi:hypothetical protein
MVCATIRRHQALLRQLHSWLLSPKSRFVRVCMCVLGMEDGVSCLLGKNSIIELYPKPCNTIINSKKLWDGLHQGHTNMVLCAKKNQWSQANLWTRIPVWSGSCELRESDTYLQKALESRSIKVFEQNKKEKSSSYRWMTWRSVQWNKHTGWMNQLWS